jgi:hypothetical protein
MRLCRVKMIGVYPPRLRMFVLFDLSGSSCVLPGMRVLAGRRQRLLFVTVLYRRTLRARVIQPEDMKSASSTGEKTC